MNWHTINTPKDLPEEGSPPVLVGIAAGSHGYYAVAIIARGTWFSTWDGFEIRGRVVKWAELPTWEKTCCNSCSVTEERG